MAFLGRSKHTVEVEIDAEAIKALVAEVNAATAKLDEASKRAETTRQKLGKTIAKAEAIQRKSL